MNQYPCPKRQIRSERPQIPMMCINWLNEQGQAEGRIIRDVHGRLMIIGRHGLMYHVSEKDLRDFGREKTQKSVAL